MYIPAGERNVYDHSILSDDSDLHIPLRLDGVTSKFYVRKPTQEEVMDVHQDYVIHVHMTSDQEWNPEADSFYEHESAIRASLEEPPLATHQARGRAVYAANRAYDFDFEDPTSVIDFEDTDVGIKSLSRTQLAAHGALDIDSFAVRASDPRDCCCKSHQEKERFCQLQGTGVTLEDWRRSSAEDCGADYSACSSRLH